MRRLTVAGRLRRLEGQAVELMTLIQELEPLASLDADIARMSDPVELPPGAVSTIRRTILPVPSVRVWVLTRNIQSAKNRLARAKERLEPIVDEVVRLRRLIESGQVSTHTRVSKLKTEGAKGHD